MRAFYIRHVLHPLFMFLVRHLPMFLDYAYIYISNLQHSVQGAMMKPDYIEQARAELARIPPVDKRK